MNLTLKHELDSIEVVPATRNYWFVRTYGGQLYEDFYTKGYVGIGVNEISIKQVKDYVSESNEDSPNPLSKVVQKNIKSTPGEATKWAHQLISFVNEVKVGDMVVIPEKNSSYLAIGYIESDIYQTVDDRKFEHHDKTETYPYKRRKVRWEKVVEKEFYNGDLRNLISSQQAITKANFYSETLESSISPLFIKDNNTFLILQLGSDEAINAFELNRFLSSLTFLYKELCIELGIEENEELYIKIKLQSKGRAVFRALAVSAIIGIAFIMAMSDDPHIKLKMGNIIELEGSSKGGLKSISNFLDSTQQRKHQERIFQDSLKKLDGGPAVPKSPQDSSDNTQKVVKKDAGKKN